MVAERVTAGLAVVCGSIAVEGCAPLPASRVVAQ